MPMCKRFKAKGVYPQRDGSLVVVDIDASKVFVGQWVHLSFAIFAIFDLKRQLKLLEMAFDHAQWPKTYFQCISMICRSFTLVFSLKLHFR